MPKPRLIHFPVIPLLGDTPYLTVRFLYDNHTIGTCTVNSVPGGFQNGELEGARPMS